MSVVLVAIADLLFASKVGATARSLGLPYERASRKAALADEVARTGARRVLVDLGGVPDAIDAVSAVRQQHPSVEVVGYCSHTLVPLMERARAAGCQRVLSQGELAQQLPELLRVS